MAAGNKISDRFFRTAIEERLSIEQIARKKCTFLKNRTEIMQKRRQQQFCCQRRHRVRLRQYHPSLAVRVPVL